MTDLYASGPSEKPFLCNLSICSRVLYPISIVMSKIYFQFYLLLGILSGNIGSALAQEKISGFAQLNDGLAARFSLGDFKGMYDYESPELKKKDPEADFTSYFKGLLAETGKIQSSRFLHESGIHHFFEWFGEKKNERIEIIASVPATMDDYFLSDFTRQPGARVRTAKTDNPMKSRLDSAVHEAASIYMSDSNTYGLSIGICQRGQTYCYNYGEIKKGSGMLPTPDNEYNIGSVAKTFVATMLAEAVVEGKVKLGDDIRKYLPGKYPNLEYKGHPIRFINLSNHTSGLPTSPVEIPPNLMDSLMNMSSLARTVYVEKRFKTFNADSLLSRLHQFKVDTIPGSKYVYNGNAMGVLILLLERIYQQPYEQLLTHYLRTHLGMYHTSSSFFAKNLNKFPQGYNDKGQPMAIAHVQQYISSACINSTMHDMLKYIQANLTEKDPAVRLTHQVTFDDGNGTTIGLNWMMGKDDDGSPDIFHGGQASAGFTSQCVFYPREQTGYVLFVNEMISQSRLFDLVHYIRQLMLDK
jgi:CubicO group peptidase (beta-lactamase class C family)